MLDTIAIVSFLVGVANYNENLTQSDKDDIMRRLDTQTRDILTQIQAEIEKQNALLNTMLDILIYLKEGKNADV